MRSSRVSAFNDLKPFCLGEEGRLNERHRRTQALRFVSFNFSKKVQIGSLRVTRMTRIER